MPLVCAFMLISIIQLLQNVNGQAYYENGISINVTPGEPGLINEFNKCGSYPVFPHGIDSLIRFAVKEIAYPKKAIRMNLEGLVLLEFIVSKNGALTGKRIIESPHPVFNQACLSMLNKMPLWFPGTINNKPIEMKERWTIIFKFSD